MTNTVTGSCLCGNVSFSVAGSPAYPHYCSCTICQRAHGAPLVAWTGFEGLDCLQFAKAKPTWYRSSEKAERGFCPTCGSQIAFLAEEHGMTFVATATIDGAGGDGYAPEFWTFEESKPAYLKAELPAGPKEANGQA
ncbi:Mss4-like protein [Hyaloraphidium curvatum]|nr:Mss4-like protein [Hyaloraphidium curvatum]